MSDIEFGAQRGSTGIAEADGTSEDVDDWRDDAACLEHPAPLWFSPDREGPAARTARELAAKAVCATCPVRVACLRKALTAPERYGIWGGMTERELREIRRKAQAPKAA